MNEYMEYTRAPTAQAAQQQGAPAAAKSINSGAGKYHGIRAERYFTERKDAPKWTLEQRIIEDMLSELPAGAVIFDCPLGTGRFLKHYIARGLPFLAADISGDMIYISARSFDPTGAKAWVDKCDAWVVRFIQQHPNGQLVLDAKGYPVLTGEELPIGINDPEPVMLDNIHNINGRPAELGVVGAKLSSFDIADKGTLMYGDARKLNLPDKSVDCVVACRLTRWLSPADNQKMIREMQRLSQGRIIWTARVANHPYARTVELFEQALDGWKITRDIAGEDLDYRILMAEPV